LNIACYFVARSNHFISSIMEDDVQFNIRFMHLIELLSCLYRNAKDGYSRWGLTNKAWKEVSKEVNDSGK